MSELVQRLAEQAKSQVPSGILSPELWIEHYNQRFAELIVQECAKIADAPTSQPYESYGEKIQKHFGVE